MFKYVSTTLYTHTHTYTRIIRTQVHNTAPTYYSFVPSSEGSSKLGFWSGLDILCCFVFSCFLSLRYENINHLVVHQSMDSIQIYLDGGGELRTPNLYFEYLPHCMGVRTRLPMESIFVRLKLCLFCFNFNGQRLRSQG